MIFTDRKITIRNGKSSINEPVILYRGDYEVSIKFTIMESKFRFKSGVNLVDSEKASHGQLAILAPYGGNVFSEIVKCEDGTVTFTLTKEMIDQLEEVGLYSFQIRLFDYYRESRVSIPPVEFGIEVREPVASEDHDNEVNNAIVGYSIAKVVDGLSEDVGDTFDADGQYNKTDWETGDRISQGKLNKIEDALDKINQNEKNDIAVLDKKVNSNYNVLDSKIDQVATKGTTDAVIKDATTEEVNRLLEAGELTHLTIAPSTIDSTKLTKEVNDILGKMVIPTKTEYVAKNKYGAYIGSDIEHISIEGAPADSLLVLRSENLFDVDSYKDVSTYEHTDTYAYRAAPIQLAPNTSYDVYLFYKYEEGTPHGITCTNFLINVYPWVYSSGGTAVTLFRTKDHKQTLTTTSSGCLYVTPVYGNQTHIDAAFNAFDIMIVEAGTPVNGYVKGTSKKVAFSNNISTSMDGYTSVFVNKERDKPTMDEPMPECTMSISYQSLDYDKISKNISIAEKQKSPLIYYTENWASFWYNNRIPTGLSGTNSYLKVTGKKGESKLTVVDGGNFELSSIDGSTKWGAVLGYGDGTYKSCFVIDHNSSTKTVNIYPPLEKDITDGELGNMSIDGMHLTKLGYRAYMQHNFNQNPKHCEKGKYLHKFAPCTNGASEPVPFKTIKNSHRLSYGIGRVNRNEVIQNSYSQNYFDIGNPCDELTEEKAGMYWEVPLYKLKGYLELMISGLRENINDILFDDGFEMHIEFYLDDVLQKHIIKKNRNLDRLCFDFENAQKGKVVVYYNKMRINNERIIISDSTWWINEYNHPDKLIPNYNIVSQLFDSWGEFHEGESGKEMSRIINEANGLTIPYYNTSKGSQTSAWGRSWWYEHVYSKRPNIMITDFGINDCNSTGTDLIPATVQGSDGLEYNNKITKAIYKENMNAIYQLCINNSIQPIHFGGTMGSYTLGEWYLYLTYGEKYEID